MKKNCIIAIILCSIVLSAACQSGHRGNSGSIQTLSARISAEEARRIGQMIWYNESRRDVRGLTGWNAREEFASLGIAHFIWYPAGVPRRFKETFPSFVSYAVREGAHVPAWLRQATVNPWSDRMHFYQDFEGAQMQELRHFLSQTMDLQTRFILRRLDQALPLMLGSASAPESSHIERQFARLVSSPGGIYALADYVNFKGEGIYHGEAYRGYGWGLKQVLLEMRGEGNVEALRDFVFSARKVLHRRVEHSPPERQEDRYLAGWSNRLETYLQYQYTSYLQN